MVEKILNKIDELRKATGYHAKYIVLNNYTYNKLKIQVFDNYPKYHNHFSGLYEDDVAKLHGIPILIRADSLKEDEYIEVLPNTYD